MIYMDKPGRDKNDDSNEYKEQDLTTSAGDRSQTVAGNFIPADASDRRRKLPGNKCGAPLTIQLEFLCAFGDASNRLERAVPLFAHQLEISHGFLQRQLIRDGASQHITQKKQQQGPRNPSQINQTSGQ